jgi:hypothetical protein
VGLRDIYFELFSAIRSSILNSWLVAKKCGLIEPDKYGTEPPLPQ